MSAPYPTTGIFGPPISIAAANWAGIQTPFGPPVSQAAQAAAEGQQFANTFDAAAAPQAAGQSYSVGRWVLAWAVIIVVLWLLTKSRAGYVAVYYALALALLLLAVTNYRWFTSALAPLASVRPGFAPKQQG